MTAETKPREGWAMRAERWFLSWVFVVMAGAIAMQAAYSFGNDRATSWTMVGLSIAALSVLTFGPKLTIGRGRYLAALCIFPVWFAALSYNGASAINFFDQSLADKDARIALERSKLRDQETGIANLRAQLDAIKTKRSIETIDAELTKVWRDADKKALRDERAEAAKRDKLAHLIWQAGTETQTGTVRGDTSGPAVLVPVLAWLTAKTGVVFASPRDLLVLLLLALTELGAALVPLGLALSQRPALRLARAKVPAVSQPASAPAIDADQTPEIRALLTWLNARTHRTAGGMVSARDLYADYKAWCEVRNLKPVTSTRFGVTLTEDIGIEKRKAGAKWVINYLGIEIKPPVAERAGRFSFAVLTGGRSDVAGARAA